MMPSQNIFGLPEEIYFLVVVGVTIGFVFGIIWLILVLYELRDRAFNVVFVAREPMIAKIVLFPVWLLLWCICLVFTIISAICVVVGIKDTRNWWHKR